MTDARGAGVQTVNPCPDHAHMFSQWRRTGSLGSCAATRACGQHHASIAAVARRRGISREGRRNQSVSHRRGAGGLRTGLLPAASDLSVRALLGAIGRDDRSIRFPWQCEAEVRLVLLGFSRWREADGHVLQGVRLPLHASALGKAFLAWSDVDDFELAALPREATTQRAITDVAGIRRELELTRERGIRIQRRGVDPGFPNNRNSDNRWIRHCALRSRASWSGRADDRRTDSIPRGSCQGDCTTDR